ncbi:MAG TPA: GNAT family N-acetyltransferase [Solirubrobacteraceae bacterium]|nr:GNAT family N-acetyltransferase [Solirubrobacteraceae bacterium]
MREGDAVTVRGFGDEDEPRVLELLQDAFGAWPRGWDGVEPVEFFRWKHHASPFGRSTMLVAEVDGELAGFIALMPWRLRFGARVRETMRGVDLAVDPRLHRRGVSMRLIGAARSHYGDEVVLGWSNPNEHSRGGSIKSGRQEVSGLRRFAGLGGSRWRTLERVASPTASAASSLAPGGESAGSRLEDEALVSRLLGSSSAEDDVIVTAADAQFLRWRYGWSQAYRGLVVEHGGRAAMAIFRVQRYHHLSVAHVCELLVERDDRRLTRMLVRAVRKATRSDFVVAALRSDGLAASCGLVRLRHATTITVKPLRAGLAPDPTQPTSWALSLGDLELI